MLNFSPEKVLLLMVIALVVLGPNRLPAAAKSLGKMIGQLRQMTGNLQNEVSSALAEPKDALMGSVSDLGLGELRDSVRALNPLAPLSTGAGRTSSPAAPVGGAAISGAVGAPSPSPSPPATADLPPAPDDPSLN